MVLLSQGDGTFQDAVPYTAGNRPVGIITGDFNGDGLLDVAAGNRQWRTATILLGRGDGTFADLGRVPVLPDPGGLATGDFDGDGRLDLAQPFAPLDGVRVFLGQGDGAFQPPLFVASGLRSGNIAAGDFDGDGALDMAVSRFTNDVMVFLGGGDGTFRPKGPFPVGRGPGVAVPGDFNGDGHLDLATLNSGDISVLLGRGDGTFQSEVRFAIGGVVVSLVTGDFNGDGHLDLAATSRNAVPQVAVLLGKGDGTFQAPQFFTVGSVTGNNATKIATGDFDRDGTLDLAVGLSTISPFVSMLLGRGDGTFLPPRLVPAGGGVGRENLVQGDFNGDGIPDLGVAGLLTGTIYVLLGRGDATFQAPIPFPVGSNPINLRTGDFNGDGRLDLVTDHLGDVNSQETYLLLGRGDGTFLSPIRFAKGGTSFTSTSVAASDLNGDGRLDLVTARPFANDAAVLLGLGDGTVQNPVSRPMGTTPVAVVAGDFNRDGRPDLAAADSSSNIVAISLGLGDGTYQAPSSYPVGTRPASVALADFTGDTGIDLAVANAGSNDVSVLVGRPNGTLQSQVRYKVGTEPIFVMAADLNGDSIPDLATANYLSGDVSLLYGRTDGTFQPEVRVMIGEPGASATGGPISLAIGDFNGDGLTDLAVANSSADQVSVLLRRPDGTFQAPLRLTVGRLPRSVVAGDFSGDGILDLATANYNSDDISVLLGRPDGTFQSQVRYPAGKFPSALLTADLNGDGRLDLAAANELGNETSILLGLGDGTFVSPDLVSNTIRSTPLVADLNGDDVPDVAVINAAGAILARLGRRGAPGAFGAPAIINADPRWAARDLALINTPAGPLLAALDSRSSSVSLYARGADDTFSRVAGIAVPGTLPVRLVGGDVNRDGLSDLVVVTAGSRMVFVYLQTRLTGSAVSFSPTPDFQADIGISPVDVAVADLSGDGRPDIAVTNRFSGDVSVLLNEAAAPFTHESRFRAGSGVYFMDARGGTPTVRSVDGTAGIVAGLFDGDTTADLVVANSGADSFSVLAGTGDGGLFNPQAALSFATGSRPTAVAAGDFDGDGALDLAVLNEKTADISIFVGNRTGGFTKKDVRDFGGVGRPAPSAEPLSAGNLPSGVSVFDVNGDTKLDLMVGNQFGDVLTLLGNGDGTFQPYRRASRNIALAVADLNGDGQDDFIFGNQSLDRVSVQYAKPGPSFAQDRSDGVLAPGAVAGADLNADGIQDLIVANSGGNDVLVYLGSGDGQFGAAHRFFVGTNPVGITVQDLNGDGIRDLVVANEGSNDVSILLGQQGKDADWALTPGPRLLAGKGPVSTTVEDATGDNVPDLLVTNSQSNNIFLLPGLGGGFFDDRHPRVFTTGIDPREVFMGDFNGDGDFDLLAVNAGSNDLTFFSAFGIGRSIGSGGEAPVAAVVSDFNGDGTSDFLVANNGDGRLALFLGGANGPTLAQAFSSDAVHPTDLALSDEGQIYVTDEGRESAILLTSFGIPLFSSPQDEAPPPLPDIFVLNGPGFATALDILSTRTGGSRGGDEFASLNGNGLESELFGLFPEQSTSIDHGPLLENWSTGEEPEPGSEESQPEESQADDAAAVIRLMIGLDEAFRARSMNGVDNGPAEEEFEDGSAPLDPDETCIDAARGVPSPGPETRLLHETGLLLARRQVDNLLTALPPAAEGEELFPTAIDRSAMLVHDSARKDRDLFGAFLLAAIFGLGFRDSCARSIPRSRLDLKSRHG